MARGYYMVSEVNQKPRKHGVKRHRMSGYALPKENWRRFKQHVELMFTGPLKSRTEEEKCSYLLIWVGQKGRDMYNTWSDISDDDSKKLGAF